MSKSIRVGGISFSVVELIHHVTKKTKDEFSNWALKCFWEQYNEKERLQFVEAIWKIGNDNKPKVKEEVKPTTEKKK